VLIGREELCGLIPHAGRMCLLDEVLAWDDEHILCRSHSHRALDHPLRGEEGLSSLHGLEYGAQAMAVHGGLLAREQDEEIGSGYLAALRQVELNVDWLHDIEGPIEVEATRLIGQGGQFIYEFRLHSEGHPLLRARATVMSRTEEGEQK
jgi:predicted hotdog family 3-hydroxylacyl-ACP dehydratase